MDILGDEDANDQGELKISKKYAQRYNERKAREELTKAKRMLDEEGEDTDSESEDEAAELLTPKVEDKIFSTLARIKNRDPTLKGGDHKIFDDDDFESGKGKPDERKQKKVQFKDYIRQTLLKEGAEAFEEVNDEDEGKLKKKVKKTPIEEQHDLKASLIRAAHGDEDEDEDDDDDLFTVKKKSKAERETEDAEYNTFLKSEPRREQSEGVMSNYWKADEDLDESEQFLRDYIMNRSWLETTSLQRKGAEESDSEESSHLEKADEFEKKYNFRFEEEEGAQIQGHKRTVDGSVREKDDKRRRNRLQRQERKADEKIRRVEELKRLKNLKKQEIANRLKQIQEVTGNDDTALGPLDLDVDFDPDKHDESMQKLIGDEYDEAEETLEPNDLMEAPQALVSADLDISKDQQRGAKLKGSRSSKGEKEEYQDGGDEDEEDSVGEWWMCDSCDKGIPAGKKRFDCTVCENYTLCQKCFRVRTHPHKFVPRRIPETCMPPEDLKEVEPTKKDTDQFDELFQLDYEDIIAGDLPTRFKYRTVKSDNFGMTAKEILELDDAELKRKVSMKKLATYRDSGGSSGSGHGKGHIKGGRGSGYSGGGRGKGHGRDHGVSHPSKSEGGMSAARMEAYGNEFAKRGKKSRFNRKKQKMQQENEESKEPSQGSGDPEKVRKSKKRKKQQESNDDGN